MARVTLVNYGIGNIRAFANIFERLNIDVDVADTPEALERAERIILPGVGAFDWAMARLNGSGMREMLDEVVLNRGKPVLGVCVGMQMMARKSEEGVMRGLAWIGADVVKLDTSRMSNAPLPHMGWNDVNPTDRGSLFRGIASPRYYFLHSYYLVPDRTETNLATAKYGYEFTAAIQDRHIFGTQFHPEKSHQWGIDLLRNFALM
jgi:glutamine amidotransferase